MVLLLRVKRPCVVEHDDRWHNNMKRKVAKMYQALRSAHSVGVGSGAPRMGCCSAVVGVLRVGAFF